MKQTVDGIKIERPDVPSTARGRMRFNPEFDSNEIEENDSHDEKHDESRISTVRRISTLDESEKLRINL
jgi:hypothetical protein